MHAVEDELIHVFKEAFTASFDYPQFLIISSKIDIYNLFFLLEFQQFICFNIN